MSEAKKSLKPSIIAVLVLVCIALASGLILSVLSDLLYVSDEEKTNRDLAKVYECDGGFTALDIDNSAIPSGGQILYLYEAADGAIVIKASGEKGWKGSSEIVMAVKDGKIVNMIVSSFAGDDKTTSIKTDSFKPFIGQEVKAGLKFSHDGSVAGAVVTAGPSAKYTWLSVNSAANVAVDYLVAKNLTGGAQA